MPRNADVLAVWLCSGNVLWPFYAYFPKSVVILFEKPYIIQ